MVKNKNTIPFSNGFIYPLINRLINLMNYLNLVEIFKYIGKKVPNPGQKKEIELRNTRIAVDLFILVKWTYIIAIISTGTKSYFCTILVWYLLLTNLYTYFFAHVWDDNLQTDRYISVERIKRRFTNLALSILFSFCSFAYLFYIPYSDQFVWLGDKPIFIHALLYSISNSLTMDFRPVQPNTNLASIISAIQLFMMFIFFSLLLGGSIPQINSLKKDGTNGIQK